MDFKSHYPAQRVLILMIIIIGLLAVSSFAEIWSWDCERSIRQLRNLQQDVAARYSDYESTLYPLESAESELERAKSKMESAKSAYEWCTPTQYNDCEWERMRLNEAIEEYNNALEAYNSAYSQHETALGDLNSAIDDFSYGVNRFSRSCLD